MIIALYARVSKAHQQNPENQLIELRRWALAMNHTVYGEFIDEISSRDTRPQKEKVLQLIRQGKINGVAFWSLDRWGRSMSELVFEIEEFSQKNYLLYSMKETLDITTASGRSFAYSMSIFANYEREIIRERDRHRYQQIKEKKKEEGKKRITCECGSTIRKDGLSKHIKTNKHQNYLKNKPLKGVQRF
jgi:DNA invertase Pin-like site-specific DNA recombinase